MSERPGERAGAHLHGVQLRQLRDPADLRAIGELLRMVGGRSGGDALVELFEATVDQGGTAIGAFVGADVVGAAYGFPTRERGVLFAHLMAVDAAWRRRGLGLALRLAQRAWCLDNGYTTIRWWTDPLNLDATRFDLRELGAVAVGYQAVVSDAAAAEHSAGPGRAAPPDRLVMSWDLAGSVWVDDPRQRREVPIPHFDQGAVAVDGAARAAARQAVRALLADPLGAGWELCDVDPEQRLWTLRPALLRPG